MSLIWTALRPWFGSFGCKVSKCCSWLFVGVESSYRNWLLLASDVEAWVGVDVLTSGGDVFLRPWITADTPNYPNDALRMYIE